MWVKAAKQQMKRIPVCSEAISDIKLQVGSDNDTGCDSCAVIVPACRENSRDAKAN